MAHHYFHEYNWLLSFFFLFSIVKTKRLHFMLPQLIVILSIWYSNFQSNNKSFYFSFCCFALVFSALACLIRSIFCSYPLGRISYPLKGFCLITKLKPDKKNAYLATRVGWKVHSSSSLSILGL
jgi:hypothetical protein